MNIFGFMGKYCSDLVSEYECKKKMIDLAGFPHDDIIQDVEGKDIPVVYIDGNAVPVQDIITLDKADFLHAYNFPSSEETYDNYVSGLLILEGEDALSRIRMQITEEQQRLEQDYELLAPDW